MLVLTRKKKQSIIIDGNIEVSIIDIKYDNIRIGIQAPKSISIYRQEIYNKIKKSNIEAMNNDAVDYSMNNISRLIAEKKIKKDNIKKK